MQKDSIGIIDTLIKNYPVLSCAENDIQGASNLLQKCYKDKHKLLICGNGGSAADSEHIVGELMKSFTQARILPEAIQKSLKRVSPDKGSYMATKLQPALRAISLTCHSSLNMAFANDVDPNLIFAQQVMGYGDKGDVLLGISTSGSAENVTNALIAAKALGLKNIGLTGKSGGKLEQYCDVIVKVNRTNTAEIQELHLPVYHTLCKMLEYHFLIHKNC